MFNVGLITDDNFTSLSPTAQLLYLRLIAIADDDGFVGNLKMLSPTKRCLNELISAGLLHQFESKHVLILHWFCHNCVKISHKKDTMYQDEKALVILDETGVYRLKTEEENSGIFPAKEKKSKEKKSKGKESEENQTQAKQMKETETKAADAAASGGAPTETDMEKNFLLFWEAYPKKMDEAATRQVFMETREDFAVIMEGLEHHKNCNQWVSDNGCFIPDPKNWLKRQGWKYRPPLYKPKAAPSPPVLYGGTGQLGPEELAAIQRTLAEG
jgi:hypothetical protein